MNRYSVNVVASYRPGVDLLALFARMPQRSPGIPDIDTTGEEWEIDEDVRIPPKRQTLTTTYEVEGRNLDEATQFALAIFARETGRASLPEPETVIANAN